MSTARRLAPTSPYVPRTATPYTTLTPPSLPQLQLRATVQRDVGSLVGDQHRSRLVRREAFRHGKGHDLVGERFFGESAVGQGRKRHHSSAGRYRHLGPNRDHLSADLEPRREWQRGFLLIFPPADQIIGEVQCGRVHTNPYLPAAGLGNGNFGFQLQDSGGVSGLMHS